MLIIISERRKICHIFRHEDFRKNIGRLKDLVDRKETAVGAELLEYLSSWFVDHIVKIDMRMTPYIRK
jgi:hemerythrin